MRVKLKGKHKLYLFNRDSLEFKEVDPKNADVTFVNGKPVYKMKSEIKNFMLVNALHFKDAAAKMLTILKVENDRRNK